MSKCLPSPSKNEITSVPSNDTRIRGHCYLANEQEVAWLASPHGLPMNKPNCELGRLT